MEELTLSSSSDESDESEESVESTESISVSPVAFGLEGRELGGGRGLAQAAARASMRRSARTAPR